MRSTVSANNLNQRCKLYAEFSRLLLTPHCRPHCLLIKVVVIRTWDLRRVNDYKVMRNENLQLQLTDDGFDRPRLPVGIVSYCTIVGDVDLDLEVPDRNDLWESGPHVMWLRNYMKPWLCGQQRYLH
ncbi:hypothetical protein QCA50_017826 [Cerrena zonata]|uniref:Uncharacterized protein n=1 Tax=Cerrena zonata TaxID=2478898 RepID=A0AAW0FNX9_9APHY